MSDHLPTYRGGTISSSPPPLPRLALVVATHTPAYFRLQDAGFAFDTPYFYPSRRAIEGRFYCVCGREEWYVFNGGEIAERAARLRVVDVAGIIEEGGAVSIRHLKEDGYTKEEIVRIRKSYV